MGNKPFFDTKYDQKEQLPRKIHVHFKQEQDGKQTLVKLHSRNTLPSMPKGEQIGNQLTDNAELDDGYRFHDVFHLAYAAVLRWSPVTRANLKM